MLPPFDKNGNLPVGVYQANEEEIAHRFVEASPRRKWLGEKLRELLLLAQSTHKLERVFIWGSFVTAEEAPGDLDVLLVMAKDFDLDQLPANCKIIFDHVRARLVFNADVFWTRESIGEEALALWLETYQTTRDFKLRGIVELILS
jgi:hypothetical protein